jgi:hypothetical protein
VAQRNTADSRNHRATSNADREVLLKSSFIRSVVRFTLTYPKVKIGLPEGIRGIVLAKGENQSSVPLGLYKERKLKKRRKYIKY